MIFYSPLAVTFCLYTIYCEIPKFSSFCLVTVVIASQLTRRCWLFASQGLVWPFPGVNRIARTQNHGNGSVSYLNPPQLPTPSLLSQQIFAPFINYSGWEVTVPRLLRVARIDLWKILSGGMPYIPHGYPRTPLRGQQGPWDRAVELLMCTDKACSMCRAKFAKSMKL